MAACLGGELAETVKKSRVFVVGTGGIGCELVKNLVLTGFQDIVMVRARESRLRHEITTSALYVNEVLLCTDVYHLCIISCKESFIICTIN